MNTLLRSAAALVLAGAGVAACHPAPLGHGANGKDRPMTVGARLDCPSEQGDLRRTEEAADGRSCRYSGADGEEVTLAYLALDGRDAQSALAPIEADFKREVPGATASDAAAVADADGAQAGWSASGKNGETSTSTVTTSSTNRGKDGDGDRNENVHVYLPGLSIEADHGRARIRAFGQTIDADDSHDGHGGRAVVRGEWNGMKSTINAHDQGVEMRYGWVGKNAADLTYVAASKAPGPNGLRAAAYVARGPAGGPLVLAVAKSKIPHDEDGDHDAQLHDLKRLVSRNVHRT